jgi:hypothetical protein
MGAVDPLKTVVSRSPLPALRNAAAPQSNPPVIDLLGLSALRKHVLRSHVNFKGFDT